MKRMKTAALVLGLTLIAAGNAAAHYTFIMPQTFRAASGETVVVGFHSADGFPESAQILKRLQDPTVHTSGGTLTLGALKEDGKRLTAMLTVPGSGHVVLTAINGTATTEIKPDEFTSYLKEEGLTHVIEARAQRGEAEKPGKERYTMYAKAIVVAGAPSEAYKTVVGLPLEIVPERDPYRLKSGESLPVRVLLRGVPARNLELKAVSTAPGTKAHVVGRTDADGRISVPVGPGQWRLHTVHMDRAADAAVDWESVWTTLTFEIR